MTFTGRWVAAFLLVAATSSAGCTQENGMKTMQHTTEHTITYGLGRFAIDIPASMQYRGGSYNMRNRDITEVIWPSDNPGEGALAAWEKRFNEIRNMKPPKGRDKALIESKEIADIGKWCKAVFYYGDPSDVEGQGVPLTGYLDILAHTGVAGAWFTSYGKSTGKDFMYEKSTDLARAYRPPAHKSGRAAILKNQDSFYLEYGAIDLPFEYKESADVGFNGHALDKSVALSITTRVIHKKKIAGLLDRAAASVAVNYAPGVKLEQLRSGKRTVAGLEGEELIERGTEDAETSLLFAWMFLGDVDSAHRPHVVINMESGDGSVKEKMALWDDILDSLRPAGR